MRTPFKEGQSKKIREPNNGEPIPEWFSEMGFDEWEVGEDGYTEEQEEEMIRMAYLIEDIGLSPSDIYSRTPKELDELIKGSKLLNEKKNNEAENQMDSKTKSFN